MANFITWLKDRKKENIVIPKTLTSAVYDNVGGGVLSDKLKYILGDITDYSVEKTYSVGDFCIYTGQLFKCHTAIQIPIAWDGTNHWTRTTLSNEVSELDNKYTSLGELALWKIFTFNMGNTTRYVKFSGSWNRREVVAILLTSGQLGCIEPISIMFDTTNGGNVLSSNTTIVPENVYTNVAINVHNGSWGTHKILCAPNINVEIVS